MQSRSTWRVARFGLAALFLSLAIPSSSQAQSHTFEAGSLIIPMDIDYQDDGMLQAFGLVFELLSADVPVDWVIDPDKLPDGADFSAVAVDVQADVAVEHAYRGGPFVVDEPHAIVAAIVIESWHEGHVTTVHRTTEPFTGTVARHLTAAPAIAIFADGHEDIAMDYLNAAAISDPAGEPWDNDSLGVVTVAEVRGPSETDSTDGALFDERGLPVYCELMTMHWAVKDRDEGAIAEMRSFLSYPTHLMAECQAVNAIENAVNGNFLTPHGFVIDDKPGDVDVVSVHLPFGQLDGEFETVGGSEPSYSLPEGDSYYDDGIVMLTEQGTPVGTGDVWMTGFFGGLCLIDPKESDPIDCESGVGKVSYLGGHRYSTDTPISDNPDTQGARLFLNSLFEADCTVAIGQPELSVELTAPAWTPEPFFDASIRYTNAGRGIGYDLVVALPLPAGVRFDSAVPEPSVVEADHLQWELGNIGPEGSGTISVSLELDDFGAYAHQATLDYRVGWNARGVMSNVATTVYSAEETAEDGFGDFSTPDAGVDDMPDGIDGPDAGDDLPSDDSSDDANPEEPAGPDSGGGADGPGSEEPSASSGQAPAPTDSCSCAAGSSGSGNGLLVACLLLLMRRRRRKT